MLLFSYVFKVNLISVGNYLNGFIINDMRSYFLKQNQHLEASIQELIPEYPAIHIYFHTFGSPLQRTNNGNHFAYLEPIPTPNFLVEANTIQAVGGNPVEEKRECKFASLNDWVLKKSDPEGGNNKRKCDSMKILTMRISRNDG